MLRNGDAERSSLKISIQELESQVMPRGRGGAIILWKNNSPLQNYVLYSEFLGDLIAESGKLNTLKKKIISFVFKDLIKSNRFFFQFFLVIDK